MSKSDENVKVCVRVRPLNAHEESTGETCVTSDTDTNTIILHSNPDLKQFSFDYVADSNSTQEEIFLNIGRPITETCLSG